MTIAVVVQQQQLYSTLGNAFPTGDHAIFEVNVRMALEGAQRLGPYSQGFYHPGPLYFYWLALPYAVGGGSTYGLYAGAYALTLFFVACGAVAVSRWARSVVPTAAFVPLLVLELGYLGDFPLFDYWPPYVLFLGYAAFILLSAGLAVGRVTALGPVIGVGSLLVQTHVTYAVPVLGGFVLAALLSFLRHRDAWTEHRRVLIVTAAALLLALWGLPIYAELFGTASNTQRLTETFLSTPSVDWTAHRLFDRVALELSGPWQYLIFGDRFIVPQAPKHFTAAKILGAIQCAGLVAGWLGARRRDDPFVATLCFLCLASLALAALTLTGIRGEVAPHHTAWISALGFVASIAALGGILPAPKKPAWLHRRDARALFLAAAWLTMVGLRPIAMIPRAHRSPEVGVLVGAVENAWHRHRREPHEPVAVRWSRRGRAGDHAPALQWALGLMLELEKRHVPVTTHDARSLRWALGRLRWAPRAQRGLAVLVTAGASRPRAKRLACVTRGDNYLLRYPVCVWLKR